MFEPSLDYNNNYDELLKFSNAIFKNILLTDF